MKSANGDIVHIREVYSLLNDFREENNKRFDEIEKIFISFHKDEFSPIRDTVLRFKTYGVIIVAVITLTSSLFISWIREKFFN